MPLNTVQTDMSADTMYSPNMRFGTSFLSAKFRDYAVNNEAIMDKATGELFMKREHDGRIISFYQNKKYINDLMLELRINLTNNSEFTYPYESETGFCVFSDYDLVAINNESEVSIKTDDTELISDEVSFRVSIGCNGFFVRPVSRDTDKPAIEYATMFYNSIFESYSGSYTPFVQEYRKFESIPLWKDSNVILYYTVTARDHMGNTQAVQTSAYVRMNEMCIVMFPDEFMSNYVSTATSITVTITKLEYYKLHFLLNNTERLSTALDGDLGHEFLSELSKFSIPDEKLLINTLSTIYFVDRSTDITLYGKEFLIALMDMPYVRRYMMKMSKLHTASDIVLSAERPDEDMWSTNCIWAESIRTLAPQNGGVTAQSSVTNFKALESYLANNGILYGELSQTSELEEDFIFDDGSISE